MNALADRRVADYFNENFVCTYLKVGAFQIIGGQKVGGNVASYYCLPDGAVTHAVPGQIGAEQLLTESRWASDINKSAKAFSTKLNTGRIDWQKYAAIIRKAHGERYHDEARTLLLGDRSTIPARMPLTVNRQAQAHWLLAKEPLAQLETVYPIVWQRVLREKLSDLPIVPR